MTGAMACRRFLKAPLFLPLLSTVAVCLFLKPLQAKPKTPLDRDAYNSGPLSAETLGRGMTVASNYQSAAAGSENPAALASSQEFNSVYATALVDVSSVLPSSTTRAVDPLADKVLRYLSIKAERGNLFFEPLGRQQGERAVGASLTDVDTIDFSANALGFAGADRIRGGSMGLSIAYLWTSLATTRRAAGAPDSSSLDTGNGVRLNFGARYPTGPTMWGLLIQNAPGFVWWKHHRRDRLPVRVQFGNTWRMRPGIFWSVEFEKRFYQKAGQKQDFVYIGNESYLAKNVLLRGGVYGTSLSRAQDRRWTAGLTLRAESGVELSYGLEIFELQEERVKRSLVSIHLPFVTKESEDR